MRMAESINYFKGEHAQTQFWSKFEITKCCGDLEHKVKVIKIQLTLFCLYTMYLCKFGGNPPTGSEDTAQKRLIFTVFLKDGDLEN